jgi:hypothetical protein
MLGLALAALLLLGLTGTTPAQAHDAVSVTADDSRDKDARSEAGQLTEELRSAGARPSKGPSPAVQTAVAGKAQRRRDLVNQLAESNPAAVLDLALTPAERAALPASVRAYVEERVDLSGELQVLHIDHEDGHSSYEAKLVKGSQETPVRLGGPVGNVKPGDQVKSSGVALSGSPTVVTDQMVVVQSPTAVGTTGPQRTAIILVMEPGVASHPYANKTNTASVFFSPSNPQSARAFYDEVSYRQLTIVGASGGPGTEADVYGPYSITATDCGSSNIRNQALAAADPDINYSNYDRIVMSIATPTCGGGGIGSIRTQTVSTNEGTQRLSFSWDFGSALGSTALNGKVGGVALHEYGHNIGVWHANSLECGTVAIGSGTCNSDEYGDPSDVMGSSGGYGHLNGVHKDILTWMSARKQIASAASTYTIYPYEDGTVNTKALMVPRTRDASNNVTGYYYLEYRKPTANWNSFASSRPDYANGVLVHTSGMMPLCTSVCSPDFSGSEGGGDSNIVDTQPNSQSGTNDFKDAPLLAGESYVDVGAGLTLQVTSTTPGSATVAVSYSTPHRSIQTTVYPETAGTVSGGGNVANGQNVTLTASPANCFVRWRENRSSQSYPNPYTFTATADRTLEAVFTDSPCAPPPANDAFPGATLNNGQQSVLTSGATVQSGEPTSFACAGTSISVGRSAWYTITPATTSQITVATAGSDYDTVLAVYTGSAVNGLTPLACNDDTGSGNASQLQFTGQAGTSYRIQVSGFSSEGGTALVTMTTGSTAQPDPQQEGPIQRSGGTLLGGTSTFTVAVRNYGTAPTPAIHPYVDGTVAGGPSLRADISQPASAAIQPGQTVTFTFQQPLVAAGVWSTTGIWLWNNDTGAAWKALPANGQSQQVSFPVAATCSPRPNVSVQMVASGDGRLTVTLSAGASAGGNRLTHLQFGNGQTSNANALIDLPGIGDGRTAPSTASLTSVPASYTFYVRRQTAGAPVTLPIAVTDACGTWQTVVGGGTGAGF